MKDHIPEGQMSIEDNMNNSDTDSKSQQGYSPELIEAICKDSKSQQRYPPELTPIVEDIIKDMSEADKANVVNTAEEERKI